VVGTLASRDGVRYVREVNVGEYIGVDKFSNWRPTRVMTVLTDSSGNLVTATPGRIAGVARY
jgi:filamentous hemagglutinin